MDAECQAESPDVKPVVILQCAKLRKDDCNLCERRPDFSIFVRIIPKTERNHFELVMEFEFKDTAVVTEFYRNASFKD